MIHLISVGVLLLLSQSVFASNYPPDYTYQVVRLAHKGPTLFAHIGSGIMSKYVMGYKNSGYLSQSQAKAIDAIVISECFDSTGTRHSKVSSIELGKEWNGTGYLSYPIDIDHHISKDCYYGGYWSIQVAFSDRAGNWDSRYNQNYRYSSVDFWGRGVTPVIYETRQSGSFSGTEVNLPAWKFIVSEMTH